MKDYNISMILIYDDGIHNNTHIISAIRQSVVPFTINFCTASDIISGCLDQATLLIMPGGADLYICEKLNGAGNQKICNFIKNGGSYLGICAGAYYACSTLDWNHAEIDGHRELGLYNGQAIGPILDFIENKSNIYDGSWKYAAQLQTENETFYTFYNGGPIFTEPQTDDVEIIARYNDLKDTPPAIIQGQYGKGRYILSSPHVEIFGQTLTDRLYTHRNNSYEYEQKSINTLIKNSEQSKNLLKKIIEKLI